jgi:acyl carrier protein
MAFQGTSAEALQQLCALAAEQTGVDASTVTPESDFFTDLNFDSLDAVEFVMKVEETFDVNIEDQQAEGVRTPRQAYEMLQAKSAGEG